MTSAQVVRVVRIGMVVAILLALAGSVAAIVGGEWAAAASGLAIVPMCLLVLLFTSRTRSDR